MGVSQKEWNGKARAAARKAAAQARKQKAPTEQTISAAYKKAHDKVRNKSPKCKLQNKVRLKRWRESPKGKLLRKRWRESPKGRRSERERNNRRRNILQRAQSKRYLRDALQTKGPISNGWPDAGRIEQKIGP